MQIVGRSWPNSVFLIMNLGGTVRLNKVGVAILCGILILVILYSTPRSEVTEEDINVNLRRLLLISIEAAERGGREVVKVINQANLKEESKGKTLEGVNIPVTNADKKSHCIMYYGILKNFPALKVISEEHVPEELCTPQLTPLEIELLEKNYLLEGLPDIELPASHLTVWIDPLDATKEYTEQLYNYVTTMVCVAYLGRPLIGVIHKPFGPQPKTSWTWLGKGRSPNLKERNFKKSENKSVIISRSHSGDKTVERVKEVFGEGTQIIRAGGSGYKSLEVASGNVTAYMHTTGISKWDICAGDAIITSLAGGSFTDLSGRPIDYSASADTVHTSGLLALMSDKERYIKKFNEG